MKMKYLILCNILLMLTCGNVSAATPKSDIPLAVDTVTTKRVGKQLVRVIEFNTEMAQKFSVELIATPKAHLIQRLDVTGIKIIQDGQDRNLQFSGSAAVSIDHVNIANNTVLFSVEYFGGGHTGGSIAANCVITVNPNKLEDPVCKIDITTK